MNILLSITGQTPQVVTEAAFLLSERNVILDRIVIMTTKQGMKILSNLNPVINDHIHTINNQFSFNIPDINNSRDIFVSDSDDVISVEANRSFPDHLCRTIQNLQAAGENVRIFACLSGGRKSMSAYISMAMSLFAGNEDCLFHVIASREFEQSMAFFPVNDRQKTQLTFSEIPFIRLSKLLQTRQSKKSYSEWIESTNKSLSTINDAVRKTVPPEFHSSLLAWFNRFFIRINNPERILLLGETGTGKSMAAKFIADQIIKKMPTVTDFIQFNCGNFLENENTSSSELFGHVRGAFTGAERDKDGFLKIHQDKVIFFDEVHRLPKSVQTKLLTFLDSGTFFPLGATSPVTLNRVPFLIFATNIEESRLVSDGFLQHDFFNRINIYRYTCKPLREQKENLPDLVEYFMRKYLLEENLPMDFHPKPSEQFLEYLMQQDFSEGNFRDLENRIKRTVAQLNGTESELGVELLLDDPVEVRPVIRTVTVPLQSLEEMKAYIIKYVYNGNNQQATTTATLLNIDRNTVSKYLKD